MKICIANTVVEFDHSEKINENIDRGEVVLTLGVPLLMQLMNVRLQPWII